MPFANPGHPSQGWINKGKPIAGNITLLDVLLQRDFSLVVRMPPDLLAKEMTSDPPFQYPYGHHLDWDPDLWHTVLARNKSSHQFRAATSFSDDHSLMTVLAHSVVQDTMWIADAASAIFATKFPAYFVPTDQDQAVPSRYFAMVSLTQAFRDRYEKEWRRLTNCDSFQLAFHGDMSEMKPPSLGDEQPWSKLAVTAWDCKIVDYPDSFDALNSHPRQPYDLVLLVRRPPPAKNQADVEIATFASRVLADAGFKPEGSEMQ